MSVARADDAAPATMMAASTAAARGSAARCPGLVEQEAPEGVLSGLPADQRVCVWNWPPWVERYTP
jgi:hypothetical protein